MSKARNILLFIFSLFFSFVFGEMINPANQKSLSYIHVVFEWEQEPDAVEYEFQISDNESFSTIISSITTESLLYIDTESLSWNETYYWRVRANYQNGTIGDWLDEYTFTILSSITSADITLHNENLYQDGVTFLGSLDGNFSASFDKNGNEIWNTQDNNIIMYNTNMMGELYGCEYDNSLEYSYPAFEFNLDFEFIWEEPNDEFVHHDMIRLPDGNYLGIAESIQPLPVPLGGPWYNQCIMQFSSTICDGNYFPWVGDKLILWDKETKEVIWSWDTFDYYSIEDYDGALYNDGFYGGSWDIAFNNFRYDWTHVNAITYSKDENAIYISCRHLSRITKINFNIDDYSDPTNGDIIWNMGQNMPSGDVTLGHDFNFSWQHSISVLNNSNIVTLDNGNLSNQFTSEENDGPITRAIEINPTTEEIIWEYALPESLFGLASGGVQKLDNGNYLISTVGDGGTTLEMSPDHDLIWEAKYNLSLGLIHRAYRVSSLYPVELSAIAKNLLSTPDDSYVFLERDSQSFEVILTNHGTSDEDFNYSLENISGNAFNNIEGQVNLEANESKAINLSPFFLDENLHVSEVLFRVSSIHNQNIIKDYGYKLFFGFGDINFDDNIDILDIVALVNHILGDSMLSGSNLMVADYIPDGIIDVLDIIAILNFILDN